MLRCSFVGDQPIEPSDVECDTGSSVFHDGPGVDVEVVASGCAPNFGEPFNELGPSTLQERTADIGRQVASEGQPEREGSGVIAGTRVF